MEEPSEPAKISHPHHWLWALYVITEEDPAPEGATFDEAVEAWLGWGQQRGYLA